MSTSDKNIDKVYKDFFQDMEEDSFTPSWESFSSEVQKQNFLSFGWKHFNIYYASVIVGLISTATFFVFSGAKKNDPSQQQPTQQESAITPIQPDTLVNSAESVDNSTLKHSPTEKKKQEKEIKPVEISITDSTKSEASIIAPKDTASVKAEEVKPKVRKVYTKVVRDTTIVNDTVSVKKKRKKK